VTAISVSTLKKQPYKRAKHDYYREPRWLIDKLLTREIFTGPVLDPACGGGTIISACRDHGLDAAGSDLVDRGFKCTIRDFRTVTGPVANTFSNPPYGQAEEFARHFLAITENKVVLLLRLAFLESIRRERFFSTYPFTRLWICVPRPSMPDGLVTGTNGEQDRNGALVVPKATGGSMLYGFFVWDLTAPVPFMRVDRL
jgi:hypothetical protein